MSLSSDQVDFILEHVSKGKSVASALDKIGSGFSSFYDLVDRDEALAERYARARRHQAEAGQSAILDAARDLLSPGRQLDPNAARVAIDALKWNAARMHPAIYGEKVQHTDASGQGPVQIVVHRGRAPNAGG